MIGCDGCEKWFHGDCVGLTPEESEKIEKYFCVDCRSQSSNSTDENKSGQRKRKKLLDYAAFGEENLRKVIKPALNFPQFIRNKKLSKDCVVQMIEGENLTKEFLNKTGFRWPLLVPKKDNLGLTVPSSNITVEDIKDYLGGNRIIDVIDVFKQSEVNPKLTLDDWVAYFEKKPRTKLYNVISLEVTGTPLIKYFQAPKIVRDIDWISNVWPSHLPVKPKVERYCLMSVAGAYTDFHIDFGGSSVWYHILSGQKIFLLVPPTPDNLLAYQKWSSSEDQSEVFFGDKVENCFVQVIESGQTLFIPSGWIHAVYTPKDSIVFGGNFLHSYNIKLQLQVYEIENITNVPIKFRFPYFEEMMWYVALKYVNDLSGTQNKIIKNKE